MSSRAARWWLVGVFCCTSISAMNRVWELSGSQCARPALEKKLFPGQLCSSEQASKKQNEQRSSGFQRVIIRDNEDHLLGRLASLIAKQIARGVRTPVIIHCCERRTSSASTKTKKKAQTVTKKKIKKHKIAAPKSNAGRFTHEQKKELDDLLREHANPRGDKKRVGNNIDALLANIAHQE